MPKGDRTGPMGAGAKSGRMAGFCAGSNQPGYIRPAIAGGARMGMGLRNRGFGGPMNQGRRWWHGPMASGWPGRMAWGRGSIAAQPFNSEMEAEWLKNRSRALQSELDAINEQLKALNSEEEEQAS